MFWEYFSVFVRVFAEISTKVFKQNKIFKKRETSVEDRR